MLKIIILNIIRVYKGQRILDNTFIQSIRIINHAMHSYHIIYETINCGKLRGTIIKYKIYIVLPQYCLLKYYLVSYFSVEFDTLEF